MADKPLVFYAASDSVSQELPADHFSGRNLKYFLMVPGRKVPFVTIAVREKKTDTTKHQTFRL